MNDDTYFSPDPLEPAMPDEPNADDLTDAEIDALYSGHAASPGHEGVADAFAQLRRVSNTAPAVRGPVAEFIANTPVPSSPPMIGEPIETLAPTPLAAKRRRRPLVGLVTAAAVSLGALGVAHASGAVDIPGLPDAGDQSNQEILADGEGSPAPIAAAPGVDESNDGDAPAGDQTDGNGSISAGTTDDGSASARIEFGDLSASIRIENDNGELKVTIDVTGVSPECEAALESLESITDQQGLDDRLGPVEAACEGELDFLPRPDGDPAELGRLLDGLAFELNLPENFAEFGELFGDFEGMPKFGAGEFGELFSGDIEKYLEDFERYMDGFDLDDLELPDGFELPEGIPGDLDLPELFGELEKHLGDLDLDGLGLDGLEGLDLGDFQIPPELRGEIDRFFSEFDAEGLDLPEDLAPRIDELFSHLEELYDS